MNENPSIHEFRAVREHPDYVFGTIFVTADFPGEVVPDDFSSNRAEDHLAEHGNWYIDEHVDSDECDECGEAIPAVDGGGLANRFHDSACSLYEPAAD
jgi:hypothetical protein